MGTGTPESENRQQAEIDAWLREGGLIVAASERAARAVAARFHRARRNGGLAAWPAPEILDWQTFLLRVWRAGKGDGRLLLDPMQEQSVWSAIVGATTGAGRQIAILLDEPRERMARLAMEAHRLICLYAPEYLAAHRRAGWPQDAGQFSAWMEAFDERCRDEELLSAARMPLELLKRLERDAETRAPLLLVGFDRILPVQRRVFDAWGAWHEAATSEPARDVAFYEARDARSELIACALWCRRQIEQNPGARLLVLTQELAARRGEIERAFRKHAVRGTDGDPLPFEFSLGVPLKQVALARGARLTLEWLGGTIEEHEVDWLISTGQLAAELGETSALEAYMRMLRKRGLERPEWLLRAFLTQVGSNWLPAAWVRRMVEAQRMLEEQSRAQKSPMEWAELVPRLLETAGWPGGRPLASAEFQAVGRWQRAVDACAALGFDGRRMSWNEFVAALRRALAETLFAPESEDAQIQIAGPAESAGLTADAIWMMGATEDAWPAAGTMHPLLPVEVQRTAGMPHATTQLDWELARTMTARLVASAPLVRFSYARQGEDAEARPSRLIVQAAGKALPLPAELVPADERAPLAVEVEDASAVRFTPGKVEGGSSVLTYQSQCPFKAFATARLGAQSWNRAEAGLTAAQRGQLLHAALGSIWGGSETGGIRTPGELREIAELRSFVTTHVERAVEEALPGAVRERMAQRYLELERERLTRLIAEWLGYETARAEFTVTKTEDKRTIEVEGLTFDVRLDRIDRLNDGTLLVVDYKTGQVTPKDWEAPRPDDVQLPLYAGFALAEDEQLGGLVFAQVRSGKECFAGRVFDAKTTLLPGLGGTSSLVKNALTAEELIDWRDCIEQLARDFIAGRAEVDPREYPKTCQRCGLQTVCRMEELRGATDEEAETEDGDE